MSELISKELLRHVISTDKFECIGVFGGIASLRDNVTDSGWDYNIYELAHRCKKWALSQGYDIASSSQGYANITTLDSIKQCGYFAQDTEFEAVLKAAQWVLDNKDK